MTFIFSMINVDLVTRVDQIARRRDGFTPRYELFHGGKGAKAVRQL